MVIPVAKNIQALQKLCLKYYVKNLGLAGSAAREDDFVAGKSDLDFIVEFLPLSPKEHADCYFGLQEELAAVCETPVDLIELSAVRNPYVLKDLIQDQVQVYGQPQA